MSSAVVSRARLVKGNLAQWEESGSGFQSSSGEGLEDRVHSMLAYDHMEFLLSSSFLVFFIGFLIAIIVFFVMKCFHYCNEVITLTWFLGVGGMELLNYETKVCDVMHRFPDVVLRFMF